MPEAARRVGRNPETIRRWIWSGKLRSRKVGTQHMIEESDLERVVPTDRHGMLTWDEADAEVRRINAGMTPQQRARALRRVEVDWESLRSHER